MSKQQCKEGYEGFLFPKTTKKKKRLKHPPHLVTTESGQCFMCQKLYSDNSYKYTEEHHVLFGSGQRKVSEENGLKVYLCLEHHRAGPEAVHNNQENRELLCKIFQAEYEKIHTREEWMSFAKRNYLEEEE